MTIASIDGGACDVYAIEDGDLRRLSRNGGSLVRAVPPRSRAPRGRHRDGHDIDAWVVRPRGRRSKGLVLQIHGGPHCAHGPAPWLEMVALADAGFTVALRQSARIAGYGERSGRRSRATGARRTTPISCASSTGRSARSSRPATTSACSAFSYGGYMTNWLLGHHPGRFAAAVSENPVLDLFSFYGESDYGFTIAEHVGGVDEPWDDFSG